MRLFQKSIALILSVLMLFSLVACDTQQKNVIDPKAVEAYENALAPYESADSYEISYTIKTKKQVGTDSFNDVLTGTGKYLGMTGNAPKARIVTRHDLDTDSFDTAETFNQDRVHYSFFGDNTVYTAKENVSAFLARQIPVKLLDSDCYENIVFDENDPALIRFSAAKTAEEWLPGFSEEFALLDFQAEGWVRLKEGSLSELYYSVTYTRGATVYSSKYTVTPKMTAVSEKDVEHDFKNRYTHNLQNITYPYALRYAISILKRYEQGMVRIYDEVYKKGNGSSYVSYINELTVFSCEDENEMPAVLAVEASIDPGTGSTADVKTVRRKQTRGMCYIAEADGGFSETERTKEFTDLLENKRLQSVEFPTYDLLDDPEVTENGSFILFEGSLDRTAAKACLPRAGEMIKGDSAFYASAIPYDSTCRIAIDMDTGFLTAAQVIVSARAERGQGEQFVFMRDLYVETGCYGAYQEIFEMPSPDTEPPEEEKATPLFYKVTDDKGNTAYLLGTIHVGDNRTAYLPQSIYDAFNQADALAVESDLNTFEERLEEDDSLAQAYASSLYFTDGNTLESYLNLPGLYKRTEGLLFAMGYGFYANAMKPAAAASFIDSWYSGQFGQYTSDKGVDMRLLKLADDKNKKVYEIEDPAEHYNALTDYTRETQLKMLEEALAMKKTDVLYSTGILYELWCEGNEKFLREAVTPVLEENANAADKAYYEEYIQTMITERDKIMVDGIKSYLKSGETVFVAVGLAHVIGENGIVDQLKEAGYTVTRIQ